MNGWVLYLTAFFVVYGYVVLKSLRTLSLVNYKFLRLIPMGYINQGCMVLLVGVDAVIFLRHGLLQVALLIAVMGTADWVGTWTSMALHRRFS